MAKMILALCLMGLTSSMAQAQDETPTPQAPLVCAIVSNSDPTITACSGQTVGAPCELENQQGVCLRIGVSRQCGCSTDRQISDN